MKQPKRKPPGERRRKRAIKQAKRRREIERGYSRKDIRAKERNRPKWSDNEE